jgi:leader peptidase (prepilin peptidase)/N-methyltransferase
VTLLAFAVGLLIGSFLNVCIHRWPDEKSVVRPRSHCPHCNKRIAWHDNIPVLSFLLLKGRCRACGEGISWRYPAVEIINGLLYAALVYQMGVQPAMFKAALFCSMMLVLIFTDAEHYILPDEITMGGVGIGLALSLVVLIPPSLTAMFWWIAGQDPTPRMVSFSESAAGVAVFGGLLWLLREVYYRWRGFDGLGFGDVKMAAMMGAFWGVPHTLTILLLGSIGGALIGTLVVLLGGKKWNHELPFGSYLGVAAIFVTFWSQKIFAAYWDLMTGAVS